MRFRSQSPADTRALAAALAGALGAEGAVVSLTGALGAGKTLFVKGLAEALGLDERAVSSPTFVIAAEYPLVSASGPARLVHADFYRVADERELEAAGLEDWLAPGTLFVAEWGERFAGALPEDRLDVSIASGDSRESRNVDGLARGERARGILERWSRRWH
jgi:tRNA threonylcarbamoyladenosine biosynthesis protein TsaE